MAAQPSSSVSQVVGPPNTAPATATAASSPPNRSTASATAPSRAAWSRTSPITETARSVRRSARRPRRARRGWRARSRARDRRRPGRPARGASRRRPGASAVAAPMPRAAPVIERDGPRASATDGQLLERGVEVGDEHLEQRSALLGRCAGGVAQHAVRGHGGDAARPQQRAAARRSGRGSPASASARRTSVGREGEEQRGLRAAGVEVDRAGSATRPGRDGPRPRGVATARATRLGVAAVARHEHHRTEGVGGAHELDDAACSQRVLADRQRAGEAGVLAARAVGQGRGQRPRRRAGRRGASATATATIVSVLSGRCGPCCSVEPSGMTSVLRGRRLHEVGPGGRAEAHRRAQSDRPRARVKPAGMMRSSGSGRGCRCGRCRAAPSRCRRGGCRARSPRRPGRWRRGPTGRPGRS